MTRRNVFRMILGALTAPFVAKTVADDTRLAAMRRIYDQCRSEGEFVEYSHPVGWIYFDRDDDSFSQPTGVFDFDRERPTTGRLNT